MVLFAHPERPPPGAANQIPNIFEPLTAAVSEERLRLPRVRGLALHVDTRVEGSFQPPGPAEPLAPTLATLCPFLRHLTLTGSYWGTFPGKRLLFGNPFIAFSGLASLTRLDLEGGIYEMAVTEVVHLSTLTELHVHRGSVLLNGHPSRLPPSLTHLAVHNGSLGYHLRAPDALPASYEAAASQPRPHLSCIRLEDTSVRLRGGSRGQHGVGCSGGLRAVWLPRQRRMEVQEPPQVDSDRLALLCWMLGDAAERDGSEAAGRPVLQAAGCLIVSEHTAYGTGGCVELRVPYARCEMGSGVWQGLLHRLGEPLERLELAMPGPCASGASGARGRPSGAAEPSDASDGMDEDGGAGAGLADDDALVARALEVAWVQLQLDVPALCARRCGRLPLRVVLCVREGEWGGAAAAGKVAHAVGLLAAGLAEGHPGVQRRVTTSVVSR